MKWYLTFFVIHALIVQLISFATKESYAKLTPISFGNTKFHDTQTKTALCITQYKHLKRNTNLTLPPEPKKYDECPYEQFFQDYKNCQTTFERFLKDAREARDNLVSAATAPDDCMSFCGMRNDPTFHFDGEDYIQLTNNRVIMRRNNAISKLKAFSNLKNSKITCITYF
uniref:Uncharacterized protein n=1 Tax=Panagrolaimus davidi TaxID=227884 RepID=A0A914QDN6_9BILA